MGITCLWSMMSESSARRPEAIGWNHLKDPSLTCLGVGAGCELGTHFLFTWASPWDHSIDFLRAWWLGSEGRHPKRENSGWKLYHFLWLSLGSLTALYPPQCSHQNPVTKASSYLRAGESDSTSCWEECQSPGAGEDGTENIVMVIYGK